MFFLRKNCVNIKIALAASEIRLYIKIKGSFGQDTFEISHTHIHTHTHPEPNAP